MRKSLAGIVGVAVVVGMAVAGCTGGNGGNTNGTPSNQPDAAAKTFTDADLVKILNTANTTLNAGGTVTDNGVIADHPDQRTSLYQRVKAQGGTWTPASCGPIFDKLTGDLLTLGNDTGAFSAKLVYGTTVLGATSSSKPLETQKLANLLTSDIDTMATQCPKVSFTFAAGASPVSGHYTLQFNKETATTHAKYSAAYSEITTAGASSTHTVELLGLDGNLLIGFAGISSSTTMDDAVKAVNAAIDAAK